MSKATKPVTEKNEVENKTEEKTSTLPSKAKETPVIRTKFIGFHRPHEGGPWTLLNTMLASEESVEHKIKLFKGECDIHILEVDLPQ